MEEAIKKILGGDLDSLVAMHRGRGLMEGAVTILEDIMTRALQHRLHDPLFDLAIVFPRADAGRLLAFQMEFQPCDLLQERAGNKDAMERDTMHSFHASIPDEDGHRPSDFFRCLQAQQDYLLAHLDYTGGAIMPSVSVMSTCPYHTICDLSLRVAKPDVCANSPWESYNESGGACWYAAAVAASLGPVKTKKLVPSATTSG